MTTIIATTPVEKDIEIYQGSSWAWTIYVLDANENPIVLTGYTAKMQIRASANGELIQELSTANTKIAITAASGMVAMSLVGTDTATFDVTRGVYDLFLYDATNNPECIFRGSVGIVPKVTQ